MVEAEMDWYVRYMDYHRNWCTEWSSIGLGGGYDAYGFREADTWRRMMDRARSAFQKKLADKTAGSQAQSPDTLGTARSGSVKQENSDEQDVMMDVDVSYNTIKSEGEGIDRM